MAVIAMVGQIVGSPTVGVGWAYHLVLMPVFLGMPAFAPLMASRFGVYPVIFRIGDFEVTSFGVLVCCGRWNSAGSRPVADLLFSRGGLIWFGGLLGGVGTGLWLLRPRGVPLVPVLAAAAPALAIGHAIGRVGCFLVGDDYGRAGDLPWAVAFPEELPPTTVAVHPTE